MADSKSELIKRLISVRLWQLTSNAMTLSISGVVMKTARNENVIAMYFEL